jgi:exosortase A-associated hydrolase 1
MSEQALSFDCQGSTLIGVLHRPAQAVRRGVLIVVGGGPQYRVGGHRQLTLWSRTLCEQGYAVMRFDYRGMGDAQGEFRGFLDVDDDIRCAIDRFCAEVPSLDEIVLWGECDAASAILLYAGGDARVKGAVLLNPWVRTEAGAAKTVLRFYYLHRLLQPSLWKKVFSGEFNPVASLRSAAGLLRQARQGSRPAAAPTGPAGPAAPIPRGLPLTESLLLGLQRFQGRLMLVLSGRDLIAREFDQLLAGSPAWRKALSRCDTVRHDLPEGDHTFSSAVLRGKVIGWGLEWLRQW